MMMQEPFVLGGPLKSDEVYIEREADREIITYLRQMKYVKIIEPRQQGKTSLVQRVARRFSSSSLIFVYVYLLSASPNEREFYTLVCSPIVQRFPEIKGTIPQNHAEWDKLLLDLNLELKKQNKQLVIILDEIGSCVNFTGATSFFSVLRKMQGEPRNTTFWLVGTFHPGNLIKDEATSPFNVAKPIILNDFNLEQVRTLVAKRAWADEQAITLAQEIYNWVGGQPYLSQWICAALEPTATPVDVANVVNRLRHEDRNHLDHIFKKLHKDKSLQQYLQQICNQPIKFFPTTGSPQVELELLGLIKADAEGYCVIRNKFYEQTLAEWLTNQ